MSTQIPFHKLGLKPSLLTALTELGYEVPTPIQQETIPILLEGLDLSAQAQTGTGKTAAFALPILSTLNLATHQPQALIITPTRELAIQVAEAFQGYARHLKGFQVAPIYGGQDYPIQLRALKRGVHVIVGTPGRVMDHLRRGSLTTQALKMVVLDEADEMLRMGFIDDVEWILSQIPNVHQTALFSATMPASIQKIAKRYLKDAKHLHIIPKKMALEAIEQVYIPVSKNQKLEVLTRFLEVEDIQAAIIFVRTKNDSTELAEKLQARGYSAAALNGNMAQSQRKSVVERIKKGTLNIVAATDVAARGLDIDRISHVINMDIPCDAETYIHRIGRTGRAGRKGKALLFVTEREHRLLRDIEHAVRKPITLIEPPSLKMLKEKRASMLAEKITGVIEKSKKLTAYREIVESLIAQSNHSPTDIAAALVYLMEQTNPLSTNEIEAPKPRQKHKPKGEQKGRPPFKKTKHSFKKTDQDFKKPKKRRR